MNAGIVKTEMLDKPVLLLKSDTVPNAAVIVTSIADSDGNPVVVALHLSRNEGFGVVTRVASLYGRKNSRNFIADQLLRGNLIGYSKKEADQLLHRDGLQLPRRNPAVDFDTISVAQDTDAVNNYSMQNIKEDAGGSYSLMDTDSTGRRLSPQQQEPAASEGKIVWKKTVRVVFRVKSGQRLENLQKVCVPQGPPNKKTPEGVFLFGGPEGIRTSLKHANSKDLWRYYEKITNSAYLRQHSVQPL